MTLSIDAFERALQRLADGKEEEAKQILQPQAEPEKITIEKEDHGFIIYKLYKDTQLFAMFFPDDYSILKTKAAYIFL